MNREIKFRVYDEDLKNRLRHIFDTIMLDDEKGKQLNSDGLYEDRNLEEQKLNSQEVFYEEAYQADSRKGNE